jgi:Fur family peroxide stress response transcriptional regulator
VKARIPKLSLFTVYRTMNAFEHAGLVRRVTTFRGHARFDADMSQHAHFVCETCGAIHDVALPVRLPSGVSLPPETSDIASLPGRVRSTDVLMCGICHACTGMGAASA